MFKVSSDYARDIGSVVVCTNVCEHGVCHAWLSRIARLINLFKHIQAGNRAVCWQVLADVVVLYFWAKHSASLHIGVLIGACE